MQVDTVVLRSPSISASQAAISKHACVRKKAVDLVTGERSYDFTTGSLEGSFDDRA